MSPLTPTGAAAHSAGMEHSGGCHCGNIRVRLQLVKPPQENALRAYSCAFCRAHATRTVSDPDGLFQVWAEDWSMVVPYRFGSRTADYLVCSRCGVYLGAVCDTALGLRAVANINSLADRAAFTEIPSAPDYEGESKEARLARRARNWMPAILHGAGPTPPRRPGACRP